MSMELLSAELTGRQKYLRADRNQYTVCLKEVDPEWMLLQAFPHIMKALERRATLVDLAVTIGRRIRSKLKLKPDGISSCQVGFFIMVSFFEVGLLGYRLARVDKKSGRKSKHRTYEVYINNKDELFKIWDAINSDADIDMYPTNEPPELWVTGLHKTGASLIKKGAPEVLKQLSAEKQPIVFGALNKVSQTPWLVNKPILEIIEHYMEEPDGPNNPLKYKRETDKDKRQSLFIVADSCVRIARRHVDKLMYSLYNTDFRGRVYSSTAFLHPQGDDIAKGLLLLANGEPIGEEGLYWLLLHGANTYGFDKAPLDERVNWSLNHYPQIMDCGRDPFKNTFWMQADKPWSFLSFCKEIVLLQDWIASGQPEEDFVSNLVCFIDG